MRVKEACCGVLSNLEVLALLRLQEKQLPPIDTYFSHRSSLEKKEEHLQDQQRREQQQQQPFVGSLKRSPGVAAFPELHGTPLVYELADTTTTSTRREEIYDNGGAGSSASNVVHATAEKIAARAATAVENTCCSSAPASSSSGTTTAEETMFLLDLQKHLLNYTVQRHICTTCRYARHVPIDYSQCGLLQSVATTQTTTSEIPNINHVSVDKYEGEAKIAASASEEPPLPPALPARTSSVTTTTATTTVAGGVVSHINKRDILQEGLVGDTSRDIYCSNRETHTIKYLPDQAQKNTIMRRSRSSSSSSNKMNNYSHQNRRSQYHSYSSNNNNSSSNNNTNGNVSYSCGTSDSTGSSSSDNNVNYYYYGGTSNSSRNSSDWPYVGGGGGREGRRKEEDNGETKTIEAQLLGDKYATCVRRCLDVLLQQFGLYQAELLQILNLSPLKPVEIYAIVDDCASRLSEAAVADLLDILRHYLDECSTAAFPGYPTSSAIAISNADAIGEKAVDMSAIAAPSAGSEVDIGMSAIPSSSAGGESAIIEMSAIAASSAATVNVEGTSGGLHMSVEGGAINEVLCIDTGPAGVAESEPAPAGIVVADEDNTARLLLLRPDLHCQTKGHMHMREAATGVAAIATENSDRKNDGHVHMRELAASVTVVATDSKRIIGDGQMYLRVAPDVSGVATGTSRIVGDGQTFMRAADASAVGTESRQTPSRDYLEAVRSDAGAESREVSARNSSTHTTGRGGSSRGRRRGDGSSISPVVKKQTSTAAVGGRKPRRKKVTQSCGDGVDNTNATTTESLDAAVGEIAAVAGAATVAPQNDSSIFGSFFNNSFFVTSMDDTVDGRRSAFTQHMANTSASSNILTHTGESTISEAPASPDTPLQVLFTASTALDNKQHSRAEEASLQNAAEQHRLTDLGASDDGDRQHTLTIAISPQRSGNSKKSHVGSSREKDTRFTATMSSNVRGASPGAAPPTADTRRRACAKRRAL